MTVTWLGHACFALESAGERIVLDPYCFECYPPLKTSADAVYCSHGHRDHNYAEGVALRGGKAEAFHVTTIHTFHDEHGGALRGENTIHIFEVEGLRVAHLGDLGHELSDEQLAPLRGCDMILLPVGGYYTIDAPTAKRVAEAIGARVVVPMHYRHGEYGLREVGEVEDFLALCDKSTVTLLESNSFELTAETPCGVIVPRYLAP